MGGLRQEERERDRDRIKIKARQAKQPLSRRKTHLFTARVLEPSSH
jgi:hypothetical protein